MSSQSAKMQVDAVADVRPEPMCVTAQAAVELKKWNPIAFWQWDLQQENCAICRNPNMELCIQCMADPTSKHVEDCRVAWGMCNHAFHFHCIEKWLKTRNLCPLGKSGLAVCVMY